MGDADSDLPDNFRELEPGGYGERLVNAATEQEYREALAQALELTMMNVALLNARLDQIEDKIDRIQKSLG